MSAPQKSSKMTKKTKKSPKSVQSKTSKFQRRLDLDEACAQFSWQRHCVRSCPMGWLEGINRRGVRTNRLCSLPSADRACWKIFFEICWEAEIGDQIRRKIRARKNRKSLKNKTSPNFHRTFVWCPQHALAAENAPQRFLSSLSVASTSLARIPVVFRGTLSWSSEIDEISEIENFRIFVLGST